MIAFPSSGRGGARESCSRTERVCPASGPCRAPGARRGSARGWHGADATLSSLKKSCTIPGMGIYLGIEENGGGTHIYVRPTVTPSDRPYLVTTFCGRTVTVSEIAPWKRDRDEPPCSGCIVALDEESKGSVENPNWPKTRA